MTDQYPSDAVFCPMCGHPCESAEHLGLHMSVEHGESAVVAPLADARKETIEAIAKAIYRTDI